MTQRFNQTASFHSVVDFRNSEARVEPVDKGFLDPGVTTTTSVHSLERIHVDISNLVINVAAADDYGSVELFCFNFGFYAILGADFNVQLTKDGTGILTTTDLQMALGTDPVAGTAPMSGTENNIAPNINIQPNDLVVTWADYSVVNARPDNFGCVYLNAACTIAGDGTLTADGVIDFLVWRIND